MTLHAALPMIARCPYGLFAAGVKQSETGPQQPARRVILANTRSCRYGFNTAQAAPVARRHDSDFALASGTQVRRI